MIALAKADAVYALGLAAWSSFDAAIGRERPRAHAAALIVLEIGLVGVAVLGVAALAVGHRVGEPSTLAGYLAASVVVLPIAVAVAWDRRSRWDSAVLAVACLALAVVALRVVEVADA